MKKFYMAAAAVLSVGVAANAASPLTMAKNLSDKAQKAVPFQIASKTAVKKAPPTKISSINDYYGAYELAMLKPFEGSEFEGLQYGTLEVLPSTKENTVILSGLVGGFPLEAPVNVAEGSYTIRGGVKMGGPFNVKGEDGSVEECWLQTETMRWNDSGKGMYAIKEFKVYFRPNGVEYEDKDGNKEVANIGNWTADWLDIVLAQWVDKNGNAKGYGPAYNCGYNIMQVPFERYYGEAYEEGAVRVNNVFKYNASEWVDAAGEATITDGWLNPMFGNQITDFPCSIKLNKTWPRRILFVNPYEKSVLNGAQDVTLDEGYIIVDLTNLDMPLVGTFVYSGVTLGGGYGRMFLGSKEGVNYDLDGYTFKDIEDDAEVGGYELPTFDADNNVIKLPNCMYSAAGEINKYTQFESTGSDGKPVVAEMYTTIQLPNGLWSGVENVDVENVDGPARYYNLQGVEVSAPAKGELVIVKKGGKAQKVIF